MLEIKLTVIFLQDGEEKKEKKKKHVVKSIELPIESLTFGFSQVELNQYTEQEFKMIAADRQEKERADARNALEEYVYELRGKLSSEDELQSFVVENERENLIRQLDEMENWLYEEGEDCNRQVYQDRLSELKSKGEPIQTRKLEFEIRPTVMEDFSKAMQLGMKAVEQWKENSPKYAHLTEDEIRKVENAIADSYKWLEQARGKLASAPKHVQPPITVAQIRQERSNLENTINPILNKRPPKAPSPPKEETKNEGEKQQEEQQQQQQQQQQNNQDKNNQNNSEEKMDWS